MFHDVIISAIVHSLSDLKSTRMNSSAKLILAVTFMLVTSQLFAAPAKVYKWTDAKGQTHYSQHPPMNTQTEIIKPQTGHSDPVEYKTATDTASKPDVKVENKPGIMKDKERCDGARKVADALKTHARVRVPDDNGSFRYLTPDEHQQKANEANEAIKESCE